MTLEDWASLLGMGGIVATGVAWVVKVWIISPLSAKIDELNGNFTSLNLALGKSQAAFDLLEERVDKHDIKLTSHDEQLHTLFKKGNN